MEKRVLLVLERWFELAYDGFPVDPDGQKWSEGAIELRSTKTSTIYVIQLASGPFQADAPNSGFVIQIGSRVISEWNRREVTIVALGQLVTDVEPGWRT